MKLGLCSILGIIFITLKLCDVIDWSWWLVLLPLYWDIILIILLILFCTSDEHAKKIVDKLYRKKI